jgi:calpain
LLGQVLPPGQSFDDHYAGIFRFRFWQYGRWVEVLVDDRLPTSGNKLIYMHSKERTEFWSALMEKAYAKLCGSYEAMEGGLTSEALTDFTGGIVEKFQLQEKTPKELWRIMKTASDKGSLMGCSIDTPPGGVMEGILPNGLVVGHAYSITCVRAIQVQTSRVSGRIPMVRIRNPWGSSHEWKGAWSDRSPEWQAVAAAEKEELGLTFDHDGEFWMSYKDFVSNYQRLEIVFLGPDSLQDADAGRSYHSSLFEGAWKRKVNAGGCRNNIETFWTNPQYHVQVVDPDPDDEDGTGSLIIGLMQKDRRKLRSQGLDGLSIGYAVYKSPGCQTGSLDCRFFQTHASSARSSAFTNSREVCDHHRLTPGNYVIVPSTFKPDEDGDFVLRIFSECKANSKLSELDDTTGSTGVQKDDLKVAKKDEDKSNKDEAHQLFINLAGQDGEIDSYELQDILNKIFTKEFTFSGFSNDLSRSMVAMSDVDMTGKLGFEDFKALWSNLMACTRAFRLMDSDKSGYFSSYELRTALSTLGLKVSNATFNAIVMRYSDKSGRIEFDDFVALYIKLKTIISGFTKRDTAGNGRVKLHLDEFTMMTMYS